MEIINFFKKSIEKKVIGSNSVILGSIIVGKGVQ